jgi:hypothetical protein
MCALAHPGFETADKAFQNVCITVTVVAVIITIVASMTLRYALSS